MGSQYEPEPDSEEDSDFDSQSEDDESLGQDNEDEVEGSSSSGKRRHGVRGSSAIVKIIYIMDRIVRRTRRYK